MTIWDKLFKRAQKPSKEITVIPKYDGLAVSSQPPRIVKDSWYNSYTGLGTSRDKLFQGSYAYDGRISDPELSALFHGNDIAARIVEVRPKEMFRRGYDLLCDDDKDLAMELDKERIRLKLNERVREGRVWGRLFGGCLMIMGIKDGRAPDKPLNEDNLKEIMYLTLIDRRFVFVYKYYSDPTQPKYGEPEIYEIAPSLGGEPSLIHESRVVRFDGAPTDVLERRRLAGWTYSVLQRCYDSMRSFDTAFQATANLLTDASQGVWKIKGLFDMIASNELENMQTRMALNDMTRSSARSIVVDADDEDFDRKPTPLSGIPETIDRFMMRLAAAAEMPVTILLGRSPAGENATGESDFRWFYDRVAEEQQNDLGPQLLGIYRLLAICKGKKDANIRISFRPLWQPSDKEQAQIELAIGQRDDLYIANGTLLPEEVALARFGDNGHFNTSTPIDVESRQRALKDNLAAHEMHAQNNAGHAELLGQAIDNGAKQGAGIPLAKTSQSAPAGSGTPGGEPDNPAVPPNSGTQATSGPDAPVPSLASLASAVDDDAKKANRANKSEK